MIQVTPQMRILVAVEPADFRKGIDGLARLCKEELKRDPFCGWVFVFRNRRATAVKGLAYDGQGFWLSHKRLSRGRFRWWPANRTPTSRTGPAAKTLKAHQLRLLPGDLHRSPEIPGHRLPCRQLDRSGPHDGAEKIRVPHESLKSGDRCPDCQNGKVYEVGQPGVLVRVVGQAPVQAKVYELQKLRCNLCGKVFTAEAPEGVGTEKYDATAASMVALLKYGSGLPFNRLERLQGSLGIPLPASTQWDIVNDAAKRIEPVYDELILQAAQGEVVYNDDTTMKILELMGKRAQAKALAEAEGQDEDAPERAKDTPKRTGKPPPRRITRPRA